MDGKARRWFYRVLDWAAITALAAISCLVLYSVLMRYVFSITYQWSDELVQIIFTYLVFLGIPIAYRYNDHVAISLFVRLMPPGLQKWLALVTHLAVGTVMLAIACFGLGVVLGGPGRILTSGMHIPKAYVYAAMPLGTAFLTVEIVLKIVDQVTGRQAERGAELAELEADTGRSGP